MSFEALAWAGRQAPGSMALKMVLLGLAQYANEELCAYPSTATLAAFGEMNSKTVTAALDKLEAAGLITDTGERKGRTGQVKVYRLNIEKQAAESPPKTEASQKRKPPVFSGKGTQKRVAEPIRELESPPDPPTPLVADDPDAVAAAWNDVALRHGLPMISTATDTARLAQPIKDALAEHGQAALLALIAGVESSPFLLGKVNAGWRATPIWFFTPENLAKVQSGKYRDRKANAATATAKPKSDKARLAYYDKTAKLFRKRGDHASAREFELQARALRQVCIGHQEGAASTALA